MATPRAPKLSTRQTREAGIARAEAAAAAGAELAAAAEPEEVERPLAAVGG